MSKRGFYIYLVFLAGLIAFWLFYQAADWTDKEERSKARVRSAGGFAMLVIPLLVYLFYKAMPGV